MDLEVLRYDIQNMTRKSKLYNVLRDELTKLGYWRKRARGNPSKGYEAQQRTLARG